MLKTELIEPLDLKSASSINELARHLQDLDLSERLLNHGCIRIHSDALKTTSDFNALLIAMQRELIKYEFGSTPRTQLAGDVYSSTEYPKEHEILLHNEMSYTTSWPSRLWFFCETPAGSGGETPVADSRKIYKKIDPAIRRQFEQKELLYVRNYMPGLDVPWQQVFNTEDQQAVEQYCRSAGISFRWNGEELKTWQKCQSIVKHPTTNETSWFNQAHLFHHSNLPAEYSELLFSMFKEDELPRNVMFADRSPIDPGMLTEIKEVMASEKYTFDWQQGEILIVDNILFAHGREPFTGERKIAVAME